MILFSIPIPPFNTEELVAILFIVGLIEPTPRSLATPGGHCENIQMKYHELTKHLNDLLDLLRTQVDGVEFTEQFSPSKKPVIGNWADQSNLPIPYIGDGIGNKSGIYFFTSEDHDVLYIGKAAQNNLHQRIWDHIQTPGPMENGWRKFPKIKFDVKGSENCCELVREGKVKVGIFAISPAFVAPLAEVYLQTMYFAQTGKIPPLCKQIG